MAIASSEFSRRRMLTLAGTTGLALAAGLKPVRASAAGRFGDWPIGVQSYSLRSFDVDQTIRQLQGLGLHHIEYYPGHLPINVSNQDLSRLKNALSGADVTMTAHGVNGFTEDHAKNREIFEFAKRAGIKNLTANPTPDSFESLEKLVAEFDVRILIHNHGPGALYDSIDSVAEAVQDRDPRIGVCVDTGHFIRSQEDPIEAVERLGERVFGVHIKDEAKQERKSHNVIIGSGFLDVVALFKTLKKIGFPADGSIVLEYEANPQNPIDDIQQCLVVAEESIAKAGV